MTVLFWEPLYYYHLVCEECGTTGLCSKCAELWESEIDLEDMEAEEVGDIIVHFDENGKPLFMEILKASKIVPLMVQGLAKKEVIIT